LKLDKKITIVKEKTKNIRWRFFRVTGNPKADKYIIRDTRAGPKIRKKVLIKFSFSLK
jgi:hypothetical protein